MNPNTTVRGGLIRLVAGPVAAFAIVGAAVGLSAAAHASTGGSSINASTSIGAFATHQTGGNTQGGTPGIGSGNSYGVHATTGVSVEQGTGGPGPTGHGAGPKSESSSATVDPGHPNTLTVHGDGGSAATAQGDGSTATAQGDGNTATAHGAAG